MKMLVKTALTGDIEAREVACASLRSLATQNHGEHCAALFGAGAVKALIKNLSDSSSKGQGYAAGALHAIAAGKEEHQRALVSGGGVVPLVQLLRTGSPKVQEEVRSPMPTLHACDIFFSLGLAHVRASDFFSPGRRRRRSRRSTRL